MHPPPEALRRGRVRAHGSATAAVQRGKAPQPAESAPGRSVTPAGGEAAPNTASAAPPARPAQARTNGDTGARRGAQRALLELLHRDIARHKRYPFIARQQQREGTATVSFDLHPDGRVDGVEVDRSSGFAPLDQAAARAVAAVAPFRPARKFLSAVQRFRVKVEFRLY